MSDAQLVSTFITYWIEMFTFYVNEDTFDNISLVKKDDSCSFVKNTGKSKTELGKMTDFHLSLCLDSALGGVHVTNNWDDRHRREMYRNFGKEYLDELEDYELAKAKEEHQRKIREVRTTIDNIKNNTKTK